LYEFGLGCNVGADKRSNFFKLIRIDTHIGISASALRTKLNKMEDLLEEFQQSCENSVGREKRKSVVAGDETFFGDILILVLMDLSSGYLILEDFADDRKFDSWVEKAMPRLEALGIEVEHAITDRAKALIKLATDGFGCESGADTFHAQHDISKWLGPAFAQCNRKAEKELQESGKKLKKLMIKEDEDSEISKETQKFEDANNACCRVKEDQQTYLENLQGISEAIHPFSLESNVSQNSADVEKCLEQRAQAFEKTAEKHSIKDSKNRLGKFRNQFDSLSSVVDCWWLWALKSLVGYDLWKEKQDWLLYKLLLIVYWYHQMQKTQNPRHKQKYTEAWEQSLVVLGAAGK